MLTHLSVRNVVLIDKLDLDFDAGLTVFTGETGAGKSILLDSLSLALGARADGELVRYGEKEAVVSACFSVPLAHPAGALLSAHGCDFSGELILKRIVSADGRSRAFINDEPVSVSFLKTVGDMLVEIHGQFASHRLLNSGTHLATLDAYGHLSGDVEACRHSYTQWQYKKRMRDEAEQSLMLAQKEEEFLRSSVSDLEQLNPKADEEEKLTERRTTLMNSEKIVSAFNTAYGMMSDENHGCMRILETALTQLERANELAHDAVSGTVQQVSQALVLLEDAMADLERETEKWGDVSELPEIDDRLFALRDMARKHQVAISELPELLVKLKKQVSQLEKGETAIVQLRQEEEEARADYIKCAELLSKKRQKSASLLDKGVKAELPALKLGKATFQTDIQRLSETDWSESGIDKVIFLVSTNKGTPLAPINKIASGGELARFMLALKVNLAATDEMNTFVFDEVDSGVGGATAAAVGARLLQLADSHQVLVVTHSPQVAAYGKNHYSVHKTEQQSAVVATASMLTDETRTDEIARMLSGEKITKTAHDMAQELLNSCSKK